MKHYITIGAALLLSAVLIFNPAAEAASYTPTINSSLVLRGVLINQYTVNYNLDSTDTPVPNGNYNLATYEFSWTPTLTFTGDGYFTGTGQYVMNLNISTPSGWTMYAVEKFMDPVFTDLYYSGIYMTYNGNSTTCIIKFVCNNLPTNYGDVPLGTITYRVTFSYPATPSNVPDPEPYITGSTTATIRNSNFSISVNPSNVGLEAIIAQSIIDAINENSMPFDDILQVLEGIRTQDQTNYTTIIQYLSDNDTFNSTLYTWLTTVLEDNFTDLLDDTTYISSVLNAARNLINSMNSRDSLYYPIFEAAMDLANTRLQTLINLMSETPAEAASMENAINQMESKQDAINDYSLPAAGNIIGNANSYVNQGTAGMNLLATILNQPLYILILMTVISLAFVSYLLYGKGV